MGWMAGGEGLFGALGRGMALAIRRGAIEMCVLGDFRRVGFHGLWRELRCGG